MRVSQPARILIALALGLGAGMAAAAAGGDWVEGAASVAEPIGGMWLDALRMTIVPLIVSLLITAIAASAAAARADRLAGRAIILFAAVLWISAGLAALLTPALLNLFPLGAGATESLRGALMGAAEPAGEVPGMGAFLRSLIPTNPIAAAAEDRILPLLFFTLLFAFAVTRLPAEQRERITGFFQAVADAMLILINWVLLVAPIGVFALAFVLGARAGGSVVGALIHYVLIVSAVGGVIWLLAYPLAVIGGRRPLFAFAKAVAPAQALAVSTQSSLACLPAMLRGSAALGVPVAASGLTLPLAVALFRATGPAMNLAVVLYVAHVLGLPLSSGQIAAAVAAAAITTMGSVSLPGQISFVSSIGPIALAAGVPVEPLLILIAVENIPDLMRTVGNVTMDVAATATVAERSGFAAGDTPASEEDRLLKDPAG